MAALNFYAKDLYGNTGYQTTRSQVAPEEADQVALVDDQKLAKHNPVNQDPTLGKNIGIGIVIIALVIITFSIV